ncbi:MAG: hypothetical protein ACOCP8_08005 [archaeon]
MKKETNFPKEYFGDKIKKIVESNHNNPLKKDIRYYHKRINFSCPYCGDSEKVPSKYRGNLWLNSLMIECYNCGKKTSFTKFCDDFNHKIELEDRIEIYNHIDNNKFSNKDFTVTKLDKLIDINEWINYMNNKKNSWLVEISPVKKGSAVYQYLINRNLFDHGSIFQAVYRKIKDGKVAWQNPVMLNLNRSKNKLLGIQIRNLQGFEKRFFKIVEFEELYNYMNPSNPLDEYEAIPYNKMSHFYNILNINFDSKITIFEGFIDSLFYPNSIGLVGLHGDNDLIKFLTKSDEGLDLQFFYDNDKDGIKRSVQLLNDGYSVFLWKKLFEDITNKSKNKFVTEKNLKRIKDLNDLVIYYKNDKIYDKMNLYKYFSKDEFDLIYFDSVKNNFFKL